MVFINFVCVCDCVWAHGVCVLAAFIISLFKWFTLTICWAVTKEITGNDIAFNILTSNGILAMGGWFADFFYLFGQLMCSIAVVTLFVLFLLGAFMVNTMAHWWWWCWWCWMWWLWIYKRSFKTEWLSVNYCVRWFCIFMRILDTKLISLLTFIYHFVYAICVYIHLQTFPSGCIDIFSVCCSELSF